MTSSMDKIIKKHVWLTVLSVAAVMLAVGGTSYAIFSSQDKNVKDQTINIGTFNATLTSSTGQVLISDIYPMKEADLGTSNKYTFTVTNPGTYNITYNVYLTDNTSAFLADSDNESTYSKYTPMSTTDYPYISYKLDSDTSSNLGAIYDTSTSRMSLKTESLTPGSSKTYSIQFWESENSPNTMTGKILVLNINIDATATK